MHFLMVTEIISYILHTQYTINYMLSFRFRIIIFFF